MRCPDCQNNDTRVIDSRTTQDGAIRRRRQCSDCDTRFTTHERIDRRVPWILKKDGRKETFSRDKVLRGLSLACRKRPVDAVALDELVTQVEDELIATRQTTLPASAVGEAAMKVLREVDAVAYTRFASVYKEFESVEQFIETIRELPPENG